MFSKTISVFCVFIGINASWAMDKERQEQYHPRELEKYVCQNADLPGTPNFQFHNLQVDEKHPLLRDVLYFYPYINELCLIEPRPTSEALKLLATAQHFLKSFRLGCTQAPLSDEDMANLTALMTGPYLLQLRLNALEGFGPQHTEHLAKALLSPPALTTLLINDMNEVGPQGAYFIAESLKTNTTLTRLKLSSCGIGNAGVSAILEALNSNTSLKILQLSGNNFDNKESPLLMRSLETNTSLTSLDLSLATLTLGEMSGLCSALHHNTSLTSLDLGYCHLTDEQAPPIADLLKVNNGIQRLVLSSNKWTKEGITVFSKGLEQNHSLKELYWHYHSSATQDIHILLGCQNFTKLDLSFNRIKLNEVPAFCEALRGNTSLEELNVRSNEGWSIGKQIEDTAAEMNLKVKVVWQWGDLSL